MWQEESIRLELYFGSVIAAKPEYRYIEFLIADRLVMRFVDGQKVSTPSDYRFEELVEAL